MTTLMVKMIAAELRNRVRESGAAIAAGMLIVGALIGILVPGQWWTNHPTHAPAIEQNHPFESWDTDTESDKPTPGFAGGALGNPMRHCLVQCDG